MQFWTFYRVFRRWRWIIIGICIVVPLVIGITAFMQPRMYVAKATFYTYQEAYQELATAGSELERVRRGSADMLRLMRTRSFFERIRPDLDFDLKYETFAARLKTSSSDKSSIIDVQWQDTNELRAVNTLNKVIDAFGEYYSEQQTAGFRRAREMLEKQLEEKDAELKKAETALLDFQRDNDLIDASDITLAQSEYRALMDQKRTLDSQILQSQVKTAALASQLAGTSEFQEVSKMMRPNPDTELVRQQLMQSKSDLLALEQRYTPDHPDVQALQESIRGLEQTLAEMEPFVEGESELAVNTNRQTLEAQLAQAHVDLRGLEAQKADLDARLAQIEDRLPEIPLRNIEYDALARAHLRAQEEAQGLASALSEALVSEQTVEQQARIQVIDYAALPLEQLSRRTMMKVLAGFMASLFLSFTFVFLLEQIDNRIKGPADVERLIKLRALTALPVLITRDANVQPTPEEAQEEQLRVASFREAVRSLRSQLLLVEGDPPPRVIGMFSARSGVGKTTVAANLAESFAQAGHRALLIDADLRHPSIHGLYDLTNDTGLSDVLQGHADALSAVQQTDVPGLHVLAAGPMPDDPAMILGAPTMREMVEALRGSFTWIIVDTPAALAHADAVVTSVALDAGLVVTAAGEIARGSEERLLSEFEAVGTPVLGAVVNKVLPQHADTLYHHRRYQLASTGQAADASSRQGPFEEETT